MYKFYDKLVTKTTKRRLTDEGYLDLPARISRVGVQQYLAGEIGLTDRDPKEVVNVYRPPEEVFKKESLDSFKNQPVTDGHPPEEVNVTNNSKYHAGHSYGKVTHDKTYVNTNLLITDQALIDKIGQGKVEVSNGYRAELDFEDGKTPEGVPYDCIQVGIKGNHIAVVMRGRAGRNVRLSDNKPKVNTVKVKIKDVDYDIEDGSAAQAVTVLVSDNAKLATKLEDKDKEHKDALKLKDDKIKELEDQNKELTDAQPDVDKLVKDKVAFNSNVALVDKDYKTEGKTDREVKADLVNKHREGVTINDETEDAYLDAAFDFLVTDAKATGKRNSTLDTAINDSMGGRATVVKDSDGKVVDTRSPDVIAREKMINDNKTAFSGDNNQ